MQIGYVGVGSMGGALARRLQRSHKLIVNDLNPGAVAKLEQTGAEGCADLGELAARCDIIFLCLPTSDDVREAIFGANGLRPGLRSGTLLVDQTTGDPGKTRAMATELAAQGIDLIDAPVSGGVMGAEAGTIAIIVGADRVQFERIKPIIEVISPNIRHAGAVGNGQVMKLVTNMIAFAQRVATLEGVALATRLGVDPHQGVDILMAGGSRNKYMEVLLQPRVLEGDLRTGFTLGLALKDLRLTCQLAADNNVDMPMSELTTNMYQGYAEEMGANAQVETSGLIIQRLAGTQFIPEKYIV